MNHPHARFLIVTINKNNASGLLRTLSSVSTQSFKDYALVVVDGASSDNSIFVIRDFQDIIDVWSSEPDGGIYNAMNKGTSCYPGCFDYAVYMNSGDEFYASNTLQLVSDFIEGRNLSGIEIIYGHSVLSIAAGSHRFLSLNLCRSLSYFPINMPMHHQSVYFPCRLLSSSPYDESYACSGDYHLLAELYTNKCIFALLDMPLSIFDASGITYRASKQKLILGENSRIKKLVFKKNHVDLYFSRLYFFALNSLRAYKRAFLLCYNACLFLLGSIDRLGLCLLKLKSLLCLGKINLLACGVFPGAEHYKMLKEVSTSGVNVIYDVGANRGQFLLACVAHLRVRSYFAFEPLHSAARLFLKVAQSFDKTIDVQLQSVALSSRQKSVKFFVTRKSDCSSCLEPRQHSFTPSEMSFDRDNVLLLDARTLDEYIHILHPVDCALLKLDVQGSELDVLRGANSLLSQVGLKWVYCEVSDIEHYDGQCLFEDVRAFLSEYNFRIHSLYNCNRLRDGRLVYADVLFVKSN